MISVFKNTGRSLLLLILLFGLNCAYYSFSGSLPPHLRSVAVPLFEDNTAEFGVKEELTDAIVTQFRKDNSLKLGTDRDSDVLVKGIILRIRDDAASYNQDESVESAKVYVSVKVECTDTVKRKILWQETLSRWGTYDPEQTDDRNQAISDAIIQLSDEIVNKTVTGW